MYTETESSRRGVETSTPHGRNCETGFSRKQNHVLRWGDRRRTRSFPHKRRGRRFFSFVKEPAPFLSQLYSGPGETRDMGVKGSLLSPLSGTPKTWCRRRRNPLIRGPQERETPFGKKSESLLFCFVQSTLSSDTFTVDGPWSEEKEVQPSGS